jgi:hypothetical protein
MDREDITRMAREAGLYTILNEHAHEYGNGYFENTPYPELERFFALAAAAEREACARVCDDTFYSVQAAAAIRARGNT